MDVRRRNLLRRDVPVPAVCYSICNNAYLEAQLVGKTPALCQPNSAFLQLYNNCLLCINSNQASGSGFIYLNAPFDQFLQYCANGGVVTPPGSSSSGGSSITRGPSSSGGQVTLPASYFTTFTQTGWAQFTLSGGLVYSKAVTVTGTLPNLGAWNMASQATQPAVTTPATTAATAVTTGAATTSELSASAGAVGPPSNSATTSNAWIAGAVIGPIFLLVLVATGVVFCILRRKKKTSQVPIYQPEPYHAPAWYDKAQLHGDSIASEQQKYDAYWAPPPQELPVEPQYAEVYASNGPHSFQPVAAEHQYASALSAGSHDRTDTPEAATYHFHPSAHDGSQAYLGEAQQEVTNSHQNQQR